MAEVGRLLSVVSDTFQLSGRRGVVVVPGIPRVGVWHVKIGDPVTVEHPDGTLIEAKVGGIEMLSPPNPDCIPLLLADLSKEAVPIGSKLWFGLRASAAGAPPLMS